MRSRGPRSRGRESTMGTFRGSRRSAIARELTMRHMLIPQRGERMDGNDAAQTLVVGEQFRGPPNSGNGGYVAGRLARELDPSAATAIEVTLRAPAPLD